jgi:hypothetical protein
MDRSDDKEDGLEPERLSRQASGEADLKKRAVVSGLYLKCSAV